MIPDFLLQENNSKPISDSTKKFIEAIDRYEKHFGNGVNTEPSEWTEDEWVDILNECVETDTPFHGTYNKSEDDDVDF